MTERTTLAEITPEERLSCVGMWCEYPTDLMPQGYTGIISGTPITHYDENGKQVELVLITRPNPRDKLTSLVESTEIIPRFDLPRVWNPDGAPISAHRHDDGGNNVMRRWMGDWEDKP